MQKPSNELQHRASKGSIGHCYGQKAHIFILEPKKRILNKTLWQVDNDVYPFVSSFNLYIIFERKDYCKVSNYKFFIPQFDNRNCAKIILS
jgi:hypothetical protein